MSRRDVVETFSVSRAVVLDGAIDQDHLLGDVFGVRSATLDLDSTVFENLVDGVVVSTWSIFKKATLRVTAGFLPLRILSAINGSSVVETKDTTSAPLWEQRQQFTPTVSMLVTVPSRDQDGEIRPLHFVLYQVQFEPISMTGLSYKAGGQVEYVATAMMSSVTETGDPVTDSQTGRPSTSIGRMIVGEISKKRRIDGGFADYDNARSSFDAEWDYFDGGSA